MISSNLREKQTIEIKSITDRVSIRVRQFGLASHYVTNDVDVDGNCYTPAVSDQWVFDNINRIIEIVNSNGGKRHIGMGEWI